MYHERQRLQRCLQHCLNNLLQAPAFSSSELDDIADAMGPSVAQRNRLLPSGNWDVNTLVAALAPLGLEVRWHDPRDSSLQHLDLDQGGLFGLVLNVKSKGWTSWFMGGRHWLAIRKLGGAWWNLDSRLDAPHSFAGGGGAEDADADGAAALRDHLLSALAGDDAQLLLVVQPAGAEAPPAAAAAPVGGSSGAAAAGPAAAAAARAEAGSSGAAAGAAADGSGAAAGAAADGSGAAAVQGASRRDVALACSMH